MATTDRARSSATFDRLIGFWRWFPVGRVFYGDAAVCALFQIDPTVGRTGEVIDRFGEHIHRDDREGLFERVLGHAAAGADFEERYRLIDPERRTRSVLSIGRRLDNRISGELCYVGALFAADDHPADEEPPHASIVEHLMAAKSLADSLDETMLARLIEAVLLETGRRYVLALKGRPNGEH